MNDLKKTKKELAVELEELREKVKSYESQDGGESGLFGNSYSFIVESVPSGVVMTDGTGKIIFVNSLVNTMLGYGSGELLGKSIEILVPERYRRAHSVFRDTFMMSPIARPMGKGRDLFARKKDGTEFPVEIGLNPVKTKNGFVVLSTLVDITERKLGERLLREGEERLRGIMENTSDAVLLFDGDGRIESVNRAGLVLFTGSENGEIGNIWEIITPEHRESFAAKLRNAKEGVSVADFETELIKKDGRRVPVSISLVYMSHGGGRFIETVRDISARVAMRKKIIELEKSQIVGRMAEGFAHHMGTPLASMLLRVQMLKEDMSDIPGCEGIMEKLDSIERQILYGQKVIQRLLKFVGNPISEKSPEDAASILTESVDLIRPLLKKKTIDVLVETEEDLAILTDTNLLHLVFTDTIMNAVDAMPGGGSLTLTASGDKIPGFAVITIKDTGDGIPKEIIPYVFEPFFTTKPAGMGTGLGLSVAKRIISDHGGEISIKSKEGEGTTVTIKLPIFTEERQ
ncbi:MAG TPA: PAS domain S-box protein [Thermodesulfobacteriota bacterium]|nr:PAS domain S-box protein [Thermodesulfobacteriota bacterium]